MRANGVSTHPAVLLFQRLIDWQPARPTEATVATASHVEVPEYLSTHPNMRDRIFLFEQGNGEVPAPGAATMKR
jgi:predicted Zn-dependent protease